MVKRIVRGESGRDCSIVGTKFIKGPGAHSAHDDICLCLFVPRQKASSPGAQAKQFVGYLE